MDSLEGRGGGGGGGERMACTCSLCAVPPEDPGRCLPWAQDTHWDVYGPLLAAQPQGMFDGPCECRAPAEPGTQPFPAQAADAPPCCRLEWPSSATTVAVADEGATVYDQPEVDIKIGGKVTFMYSGSHNFENVVEVSQWSLTWCYCSRFFIPPVFLPG
eukprot:SAG22_NODE_462_length_10207_cov_30.708647_5_plen_159_part_00